MADGNPGSQHKGDGKSPRILGYAASPAKKDFDAEYFVHIRMPLILLGAGLLVHFAAAWWQAQGEIAQAFAGVGLRLLIDTGVMLACIYFASRVRGFKLGPFNQALIKLMAISVAPSATMMLLGLLLWFLPFSFIIIWVIGFCFYFALLGMFLELDQDDTWYCVIAIFIAKVLLVLLLR